MKKLKGIPASEGMAIGPAFIYQPKTPQVERRTNVKPKAELVRLETALATADQQLEALKARIEAASGAEEAQIFQAHRLFLSDPVFVGVIRQAIEAEKINAEAAVEQTVAKLADQFRAMDNEYFRARAADIVDVGHRVLRLLAGWGESSLTNMAEPAIVLAADLTPSDTASLDRAMVLAFCTATGGTTSHTAILARSLGIPAVAGLGEKLLTLQPGEQLLVDGYAGEVFVQPDPATVTATQSRYLARQQTQAEALIHAAEPAVTQDNQTLTVLANIGGLADAERARDLGAEGVGLLRTEFLFLQGDTLPDEEQQYQLYQGIADIFPSQPVIIRTLDVGGDKPLPALEMPKEENPFLGRRAVRLSLAEPALFQTQLRAILRAAHHRHIKIMFPMIGSLSEFHQARAALEMAKASLAAEKVVHNPNVEVGIMVEIPSAALLAPIFAAEVDFFSIGTNDLAQYTLAADRTNPLVAPLADPFHPAVLRLIQEVIQAGQLHHKEVGMCGEMAGNLLAIPLLVGMGLTEFSMTASAIPSAKALIRSLSRDKMRRVADQGRRFSGPAEVRHFLNGLS